MKARIQIGPDGSLIIEVKPEQLQEYAYDIPPGVCGYSRLPVPAMSCPHLIGKEIDVIPKPPVSLINDFGLLGLPILMESIFSGFPEDAILQLLPKPKIPKVLLSKLLLPELPEACIGKKTYAKKLRIINVDGKKIGIALVNDNGKRRLEIYGPEKGPKYVGSGLIGGERVQILISGLKSVDALIEKLKDNINDITIKKVEDDKDG